MRRFALMHQGTGRTATFSLEHLRVEAQGKRLSAEEFSIR